MQASRGLLTFLLVLTLALSLQMISACEGPTYDAGADDEATADDDDADDDDDLQPDFPSAPKGHRLNWGCYLCHESDFLGSKGEPHQGAFDAPIQCARCHDVGTWEYTNPNAPVGHGSTQDCRNCHQNQHDKAWTDPYQCLVCHRNGTAPDLPTYPLGHKPAWDCYLCHTADFLGAAGEPHEHGYTSPAECLNCHQAGDWNYTSPNAPDGHGSTANCLNCHQGQHAKTWTDPDQCFTCHQPGQATQAPTYPQGHEQAWDCYLCHAADFLGAQGEPHAHQYTSPAECLNCHEAGTWDYTNPNAPEGHGSTENCQNCHQGQHGKTWTDRDQCFACHEPGQATQAPTYPTGHGTAWNCYLCHAADFLGAQGEPHGHQYTAPAECLNCHEPGTWDYTNPAAPDGHGSAENCLNCHQGLHGKTWTDKNQCLTCHQPGAAVPKYPNTHDAAWNCYLCHNGPLMQCSTGEPHGHQYTAPSDCVGCHLEASTGNPNCADGHNYSQNCITCHGASQHGRTFISKDQCLVCH